MTPQDATEVVPYLTSAATIVYVQKWLKTLGIYQRFVRAFPGTDRWAHWTVAALGSILAAAGIHWVWSGTIEAGGTLTIAIPSLAMILHGLADWFKVYILQHTLHDATSHPPDSTRVSDSTLANIQKGQP